MMVKWKGHEEADIVPSRIAKEKCPHLSSNSLKELVTVLIPVRLLGKSLKRNTSKTLLQEISAGCFCDCEIF